MKAIVGIDISKKDFTVALLLESKVRKNEFDNNEHGFKKLKDWLIQGFCTKFK
jgi:transposase